MRIALPMGVRSRLAGVGLLGLAPLAASAIAADAKPSAAPPDLVAIYRQYFSDNLPDGYTEVMVVEPAGRDVRVRNIRTSTADPFCGGTLMRATEQRLPATTVGDVTGNLCALTPRELDRAFRRAIPRVRDNPWHYIAATYVVARCGTSSVAFSIPQLQDIDQAALTRQAPRVAPLVELGFRVRRLSVAPENLYYDPSPAVQDGLEAAGVAAASDLSAAPLSDLLPAMAKAAAGYVRPGPDRSPAPPEIVDAERLHLAAAPLPTTKTAHVIGWLRGDVTIRLTVASRGGNVVSVAPVSGLGALAELLTPFVRQWRFETDAIPTSPVDVTIRFALRCPGSRP